MGSCSGEVASFRPTPTPLHKKRCRVIPLSSNLIAHERKLVCVTSGNSYLSICIIKLLLARGYRVRITLQNEEDLEDLRAREKEIARVESVVLCKMGDLDSLCEAFTSCDAVFHTCSFVDPKGISGYSERKALLEAAGAENVIEACGRTPSVKRCIFTSSLLACVWQSDNAAKVVDETCWSDEQFCRDNKLWLALGKTVAEKIAWRKSKEMKVKLVTICPALLTFPTVPYVDRATSMPYLKEGRIMFLRGTLAVVDVTKVAKAHVRVYEAIDDGAYGRYLCFDRVIRREDEVLELEHMLHINGALTSRRNVIEVGGDCILSSGKLIKLMSYVSPHLSCNSR